MGIPGLWKIISPAVQTRSLTQLSVTEGFERDRHGNGTVIFGVDASIWLVESQIPFRFHHSQAGANPELRTLFFRLARLLQFPVNLLFVFDGEERPAIKRGKKVIKTPHWLTRQVQEMLSLFGFNWYSTGHEQAPGEAEAELAILNRTGIVDAVFTNDSDIFVFGATHVVRNPDLTGGRDEVDVYTADAIVAAPGVSLSLGGMLLIALIGGGDYDPAGLRGFGASIAIGLAHSGFGDSLHEAALGSRTDFPAFLARWREDIRCELRTNSSGHLGRKYGGLANRLPETFPDMGVIDAYIYPATSWSQGARPSLPVLSPQFPNVAKIASFCHRNFSWGGTQGTLEKMHNTLWEGLCICMLRDLPLPYLPISLFVPSAVQRIRMRKLRPSSPNIVSYRIVVSTTALDRRARRGLFLTLGKEVYSLPAVSGSTTSRCCDVNQTCTMWVPGPLLKARLPFLVNEYDARTPGPFVQTDPPPLILPLQVPPSANEGVVEDGAHASSDDGHSVLMG